MACRYFFNKSKSYCIDKSGNVLNGIMDFDSNKKTIKLTTTKAYACTVYFDRDEVAPEVLAFYIGDESKPSYTNQNSSTVYAKWEDDDVASYCITKNSSSDSCSWNETNAKQINISYDLGNEDGNVTVYIYLKDNAGNVSKKAEASIILDTTGPVIKAFYLGGNHNPTYTTSKTSSVYAKWDDSDVSSYCVSNINSSDGCIWNSVYGPGLNVSYTLNSEDGVVTRYMYLRDSLGNISTPAQDAITLDTTKPTIKVFYIGGSSNPSTTTNESSIYAKWDDSDVASYCITSSNSSSPCSWIDVSGKEFDVAYNFGDVEGSVTRYLFLKDKAGLVSSGGSDAVMLPIAYAIYSESDQSLTFVKVAKEIKIGDTYNGKVVTNVFTGFEKKVYKYDLLFGINEIPWKNCTDVINVIFEDKISPINTSNWFRGLTNVNNINVEKLNISNVTDISYMFYNTGKKSSIFEIKGLSQWKTSNVVNMQGVFSGSGANATTWSIGDLSGWDTSNVTNMSYMFGSVFLADCTGCKAKTFNIGNLSGWDVSKVTNMSFMFSYAGKESSTFYIGDLSGWTVSNVENMDSMFQYVGGDKTYIQNLSNWDVTKVLVNNSYKDFNRSSGMKITLPGSFDRDLAEGFTIR